MYNNLMIPQDAAIANMAITGGQPAIRRQRFTGGAMMRSKLYDDKGSVAVLAILSFTVLLGFAGLVIDTGLIFLEKARLQNAVDAAALAGGRELPNAAQSTILVNQYISDNHEDPANCSISFLEGNRKLKVSMTKNVSTFFMPLFGIADMSLTATAAAILAPVGGPFNYAIFSGSTTADLSITGGGWVAKGSIHTNSDMLLIGGGSTVTGAAEAAQQVMIVGGGNQIGSIQNNSPVIEMPDYSDSIAAAAAAVGQVYGGNKTITSGGFTLGNSIYVKGNLNVTGGDFTSTGALLADGDISVMGGSVYVSGSNQVCFYSKNGNITFQGGGAAFNGVLYAPNGRVTITGGGVNFNGAIIAKEVVMLGGGININRTDYPVTSIPSTHTKLVE